MSTASARVAKFVSRLVLVVGLAGWSVFWWHVVGLHLKKGDLDSAVITTAVVIVPAVSILVWYVGKLLIIDRLSPAIDVNMSSS